MPVCMHCGSPIEDHEKFCGRCGRVAAPTRSASQAMAAASAAGLNQNPSSLRLHASVAPGPLKGRFGALLVAILIVGGLVGALGLLWSGETEGRRAHAASAQSQSAATLIVGSWAREVDAGAKSASPGFSERLFFSSGGTFRREIRYRSGPIRFSPSTGRYQLDGDRLALGPETWRIVALTDDSLQIIDPGGAPAAYRRGF